MSEKRSYSTLLVQEDVGEDVHNAAPVYSFNGDGGLDPASIAAVDAPVGDVHVPRMERRRLESGVSESVWLVSGAAADSVIPGVDASTSSVAHGTDSAMDEGGAMDDDSGAALPDLSQRRPGTRHAGGGRTIGTGRRTRTTLSVGYACALALFITCFGLDEWMSAVGVEGAADGSLSSLTAFVEENANVDYSGQVWPLESVVGAVARFSDDEQHAHGDREVIVTWVALRGNVACTCVQSTSYEASLDPEAEFEIDTACDHAAEFSSALARLGRAARVPEPELRRRLAIMTDHHDGKRTGSTVSARSASSAARRGANIIADDVEVFDTGGLPVAVVVSGSGCSRVPAPVKCSRKGTSCCYCDSARASSCTHIQQTRHLRQSNAARARRLRAQPNDQQKQAVDSISQLPISAFDCNRSVQVDMDILDHARSGRPYVIDCPAVCRQCLTPRGDAEDESQEGTILCHNGFCRMLLMAYTCSNKDCNAWVTAEGREEGVVINSPATAASASVVRHFCHEVSVEGDTFSKVFRTWWKLACGRSRAGIVTPSLAMRGQRTVARLMSTGMRLTADDPPHWPFDCSACSEDGRIRVVSADGIWLGHLQRRAAAAFEDYSEACLPDAGLLDKASLIPSEWVRRFVRLCLQHPEKAIAVTADQRRSAFLTLGLLVPAAVPPELLAQPASPVAQRMRNLLGILYDLNASVVNLVKGLITAQNKIIAARTAANQPPSASATERAHVTHLRAWLASPLPAAGGQGAAAAAAVGADLPPGGGGVANAPVAAGGAGLPAGGGGVGNAAVAAGGAGVPAGGGAVDDAAVPAGGADVPAGDEGVGDAAVPAGGAGVPAGYQGVGDAAMAAGGAGLPAGLPAGGGGVGHAAVAAGAEIAGGVPTAPTSPLGGLQACAQRLSANNRKGLLFFVAGIFVDPAVTAFKPRHVPALRKLFAFMANVTAVSDIRLLLRAATKPPGEPINLPEGVDATVVDLLRDICMLQPFLTGVSMLGDDAIPVCCAAAACVEDVTNCVEAYFATRHNGPAAEGSAAAFDRRWAGEGKTEEEMYEFFMSQFPHATDDVLQTGVFFPGRRQCRAAAFGSKERPETGSCTKNYQAARKAFSPGAFIVCCTCDHPKVLGFVVLDKREGPPALLNAITTRFSVLPDYIIYDFGCGAVRSALAKMPWLLSESTITSDEFHVVNHVCSILFDPRSFWRTAAANTVAHEQRNRAIKLLHHVLRATGQVEYTRVLSYHMLLQNIKAQARDASPRRIAEPFDFSSFYFSREACMCGCGHTTPDPFAPAVPAPVV